MSSIGDWLYLVALIVLVYRETQDPVILGIVGAARMIPYLVLSLPMLAAVFSIATMDGAAFLELVGARSGVAERFMSLYDQPAVESVARP